MKLSRHDTSIWAILLLLLLPWTHGQQQPRLRGSNSVGLDSDVDVEDTSTVLESDGLVVAFDKEIDVEVELEILQELLIENSICTEEMKESIEKLIEKSKTDPDWFKDNKDNIEGVVKGLFGAVEKFKSGKKDQITLGVLEIVTSFSKFAPYPANQLTSLFSSLIGGFLGVVAQKEQQISTEQMIKDAIDYALAAHTDQELRNLHQEEMAEIAMTLRDLDWYAQRSDEQIRQVEQTIVNKFQHARFSTAGVRYLARLNEYISNPSNTATNGINEQDSKKAKWIARYIYAYSQVAVYRMKILTTRSTIYARMENPGHQDMGELMMQHMDAVKEEARDHLRGIAKIPGNRGHDIHTVYAALYSQLTADEFDFVNAFFENVGLPKFRGKVVYIKETRFNEYLQASTALGGIVETTRKLDLDHDTINKFVIVGNSSRFSIFSLHTAQYIRLNWQFFYTFRQSGKIDYRYNWEYHNYSGPDGKTVCSEGYRGKMKCRTAQQANRLSVQNSYGYGGSSTQGRITFRYFSPNWNQWRMTSKGIQNIGSGWHMYNSSWRTGKCQGCNGRSHKQVLVSASGLIPSDGGSQWKFFDLDRRRWNFSF